MATLTEIRAQYPAYASLDDKTLADALYQRYYSHADRREFDARVGLTPYQNAAEVAGTVLTNLPTSLQKEGQSLSQQLGESMTDFVDPKIQVGLSPPLDVTPGAPIEGLLDQPAAQTFDRTIAPGRLLPDDAREQIGATGARISLEAQLRKAEADKALAANPVDAAPGSVEFYAGQAAAAAVEMAPPIIASVLAKSPAPLAAYFGFRSAGQGVMAAQEAGAGVQDTAAAGALYATAEILTEAIAGRVFLEGGKTLLSAVLRGAGVEGLTEGATEALQVLVDQGLLGADMTVEEAANRIKDAAIVGGMAGGGIAAGIHATGAGEAQAPSPETAVTPPEAPEPAPEDQLALPAPETPLALPPPAEPPVITRRNPAPETVVSTAEAAQENIDHQAQLAMQRTRQTETLDLLKTARETVQPLGTFTEDALPSSAVQRVNAWRVQTGKTPNEPISIEDMARAKVPQSVINEAISTRRPLTEGEYLTPLSIKRAADERNLVATDANFKELAYRATGTRNLARMNQTQLKALLTTIEAMPAHPQSTTIPVTDVSPFTDGQYNKALDAVRTQGRFTLQAVKDATGLAQDKDARAVRDAMVRRGQLVAHGKGDYRLYDTVGQERQPVPDDMPKGAFQEYVVKRLPVGQVQVKQDGKSIGRFGSASEARSRVSQIRAKEADAGTPSSIEISDVGDVAYGVMENRYDEQGNLIGQVAVETTRDAEEARKLADKRNAPPDTGARYIATPVEPKAGVAAAQPVRRPPPPPALAGRLEEVQKNLNNIAKERGLPLLGTKVRLRENLPLPEGAPPAGATPEGTYQNGVMEIATGYLTPDMTTAEITETLAQVMDHELIHALSQSGVLAPDTAGWQTLSAYTERAKRPGTEETYAEWAERVYSGVKGYEAFETRREEAIAEVFRTWARDKRAVTGRSATVFRQLVEWFRRLLKQIPVEVFDAIESGQLVRDALTPPGVNGPRARTTQSMDAARKKVATAQQAENLDAVRAGSREFLRAQAQSREDRYGRSGPKTVQGTTTDAGYALGDPMNAQAVEDIRQAYREKAGISEPPLSGPLVEDPAYMAKVADAQAKAVHDPQDAKVAKAYRALIAETKAMFNDLGPLKVERWSGDGAPYASPAEMLADVQAGQLKMRLTDDMFGESPDNPGHPMNAASGYATTDGTPLTNNDLLRIVHDIYGRGGKPVAESDYAAYHEHARLLSEDARRALATETLAQDAWHRYGPQLRRADGTVPQIFEPDYLPAYEKEFAEQKAALLPEELLAADPGLKETTPKFSLNEDRMPGGRLYGNPKRSPGGVLSKPDTASPTFSSERDGNKYFGGDLANEQLGMSIEGTDGATLIYLAPDDLLSLMSQEENPEQAVYNQAVAEGYKFSAMPSLVLDGYAGIVRVTDSDGAFIARALQGRAEAIPVVIYPKRKESMGLVSALESKPNKVKVPWPHMGRQENFPDARGEGPKYSLNAPFGQRVEDKPPEPWAVSDQFEAQRKPGLPYPNLPEDSDFNVVYTRVDNGIGRLLKSIARSKSTSRLMPEGFREWMGGGSVMDFRIRHLDDKMLSVKEWIEKLKEGGGVIAPDSDFYMAEQRVSGRTVARLKEREDTFYKPLLDEVRKATAVDSVPPGAKPLTVKDINRGLVALHAPEANAFLRARGSTLESPSGMSNDVATKVLNAIALNGHQAAFDRVVAEVRKTIKDTNETRVAGHLISLSVVKGETFEFYVPLRSEDVDIDGGDGAGGHIQSGRGMSVAGLEDRHRTGRETEAGDVLANVILQNAQSVTRAEKNIADLAFARMLSDNPDNGVGRIVHDAPTIRQYDSSTGKIREFTDPNYRKRKGVFIAKYEGQEIVMQIEDERVWRALAAPYAASIEGIHKLARGFGKIQSIVNTSSNLVFAPFAFLRDVGLAAIIGNQYDIPKFTSKFMANIPNALAGIAYAQTGKKAPNAKVQRMVDAHNEMYRAGGGMEFMGVRTIEKYAEDIRKTATSTKTNMKPRQAREMISKVARFVNGYNKMFENSVRLAAYQTILDSGGSQNEAVYAANNIAANFTKGSENKALWNAWYVFYNAGTQGGVIAGRALQNKRVQKIVGGLMLAGFLQDMINRAMSGDSDDNGVKDYDEIPEWQLETNFIIMDPLNIGGRLNNPGVTSPFGTIGFGKGYFSFPMPWGLNAFHNFGRNLSAMFSGSPAHAWSPPAGAPFKLPLKNIASIVMTSFDANNPLGGSNSLLNFVAPTMADPVVDLVSNTNFFGGKIAPPAPSYGPETPDSQRHWANTGPIPIWVAEHINRLAGGNDARSSGPFTDFSPDQYEYVYDYLTGATGTFAKRLVNLGFAAATGSLGEVQPNDIPVFRRLVGTTGNRGNTELFYDNRDEVMTVAGELKLAQDRGDSAFAREVLARSPGQARLIELFMQQDRAAPQGASPTLYDLRKAIRDLRDNDQIDPARRRELIHKIQERQDALMAQINKAYFAAVQPSR